ARNPEGRHDGVPGELLDRAAVPLDAAGDAVEEVRHAPASDLRVLGRQKLRRGDEVREHERCELSLHGQILGTRPEVTAAEIQLETDTEARRGLPRRLARLPASADQGARNDHRGGPGSAEDQNPWKGISARSVERPPRFEPCSQVIRNLHELNAPPENVLARRVLERRGVRAPWAGPAHDDPDRLPV